MTPIPRWRGQEGPNAHECCFLAKPPLAFQGIGSFDPGLDPGEECSKGGVGPQRALPVGRGPGGQDDDSAGLACESEEEAHGPLRFGDASFPP